MDTYTIAVMTITVSFINACIVSLMAYSNKANPALLTWAAALWCIPFAVVGYLLRQKGLLTASVLFGNLLLNGGILLLLLGMAQFLKQPANLILQLSLLVLLLALMMVFTVALDSFQIRTVIASGYLVYLSFLALKLSLKLDQLPLSRHIFQAGFLLIAGISLLRSGEILFVGSYQGLLEISIVGNLSFVVVLVATWALTYAVVIVPGEHNQTQLARLSEQDELTCLLNRRALIGRYEQLGQSKRGGWFMLIFDLDFFKAVNDQYGHHVGDLVLQEFARLLEENKRSSDLLARLGGEEFALLGEISDPISSRAFAEDLREKVERHFASEQQILPTITTSIGMAYCRTQVPIPTLLFYADYYLYRAKSAGRNQVYSATDYSRKPS